MCIRDRCAVGKGGSGTPKNSDDTQACNQATFKPHDQWKIHVADIENCEYYISTEGERFITDDNANPPVCYNYGKCMPITTDATTVSEAQKRPQLTAPGLVKYDKSTYTLTSEIDPNDGNRNAKFNSDVEPGDIIRIMKTSGSVDIRVTGITSDTELLSDYLDDVDASTAYNYKILKCAAGRIGGDKHDAIDNTGGAMHIPDDSPLAYLPHPEHSYYQTWSYKYCEIDPGCCGFRVSSIVQPQQPGCLLYTSDAADE